jgi:hypothetical protein
MKIEYSFWSMLTARRKWFRSRISDTPIRNVWLSLFDEGKKLLQSLGFFLLCLLVCLLSPLIPLWPYFAAFCSTCMNYRRVPTVCEKDYAFVQSIDRENVYKIRNNLKLLNTKKEQYGVDNITAREYCEQALSVQKLKGVE